MTESLTQRAQSPDRVKDNRPFYELYVAGQPFDIASAEYTCSENGTTDLKITSYSSLERFQNARVRLFLGYGDPAEDESVEYFTGELNEPSDDQWGEASEASAFGPFTELTEQRFLSDTDYRGWPVARALLDITNRARPAMTQAEITAGGGFILRGDEAVCFLEDKLGEKASELMESASMVSVDLPGWRRRYMAKPRPGGYGGSKALYTESHYAFGAFKAHRNDRDVYSRVLIYRRDSDGEHAFPPVLVPIENEGSYAPPPNKVYEVEEFVGGYGQARDEAARLASSLREGTYEWSLTIPVNPDLYFYDQIDVETTELRDEGFPQKSRYLVRYGCLIDKEVGITISREEMTMTLSGMAVKRWEERVEAPERARPKRTHIVGSWAAERADYVRIDSETIRINDEGVRINGTGASIPAEGA